MQGVTADEDDEANCMGRVNEVKGVNKINGGNEVDRVDEANCINIIKQGGDELYVVSVNVVDALGVDSSMQLILLYKQRLNVDIVTVDVVNCFNINEVHEFIDNEGNRIAENRVVNEVIEELATNVNVAKATNHIEGVHEANSNTINYVIAFPVNSNKQFSSSSPWAFLQYTILQISTCNISAKATNQ